MDAIFFLRGLIIGFSIAAPVGPIGVLCIRRTLANGRASGLVSGLGAATADACYGSIAALGLTFISQALIEQQDWLRLAGGLFLVYLGVKTFLAKPAAALPQAGAGEGEARPTYKVKSLAVDYASTLLLTLTNPLTILSFAAVFAGLGLAAEGYSPASAMLLVAGVFCGSALWWLILSAVADMLRARFLKPGALRWVNRLSGVVIAGFGLAALASLFPGY